MSQQTQKTTAPIPPEIMGDWVIFEGQDLTPGDRIYHTLYGVLSVEVATSRGTLNLTHREGWKVDCTHNKGNIQFLWKAVPDTDVEPMLTTHKSWDTSDGEDVW